MEINIKRLHPNAVPPKYSHGSSQDAGMDLRTIEEGVLQPGEHKLFKTGIAISLPQNFMGKVAPRSGLAYKHGVTVLNGEGTIDPSYRGDVGVVLINHGNEPYTVNKGDRIAQLIVEEYEQVEWNIVDELDDTVRGANGYGSTGKK